jgi:mannose-6-phosphate isomerase-like protein (cupin superfamily)
VYYPWGISKLLEHKDNYTATKLTVYPHVSSELPAKTNTVYHLFILKGQAKLITGSEEKTLDSGEAITCGAEEQTRIENTTKTELSLIQLELKNKVDD